MKRSSPNTQLRSSTQTGLHEVHYHKSNFASLMTLHNLKLTCQQAFLPVDLKFLAKPQPNEM